MRRDLKWQLIIVGILGVFLLDSCGNDTLVERPDPVRILEEDLIEIQEYLDEKGYTDVDTTASRVRFVVLDEGNGEAIEYNDIVTLNYTCRSLEDEFLFSSIDSVVNYHKSQEDSSSTITRRQPLVFTHTSSGWGMSFSTSISGLIDGSTIVLNRINVNGRAMIIIPSTLVAGTIDQLTLNGLDPLVFDIYPVKVRK